MPQQLQLPIFLDIALSDRQKDRSGTFVDNMKLPVHRWFRYSAGFSAQWAEFVMKELCLNESSKVLDPFAGSGTTLLAADKCRVPSVGIEAHAYVARISRAKLLWANNVSEFGEFAKIVLEHALRSGTTNNDYPKLINRCFSPSAIDQLTKLKLAWINHADASPASELTWLAINSILRSSSFVGTAQWQYILPNKTKKTVIEPFDGFQSQIEMMQVDMLAMQREGTETFAQIIYGDARSCPQIPDDSVDAVITSPPYANNYDYADATRFEMSFWKEVQSWGDLHQAVRKDLIISSSQHASKEKLILDELLSDNVLAPIRNEISDVCYKLARERLQHGGQKHYHTMIAAYFRDMANVWCELRRICKTNATLHYVIGDSAPYGVYVPVNKWLGDLAITAGFTEYSFEKLRDRNIKWKNRKHRVPLHEGILQIRG